MHVSVLVAMEIIQSKYARILAKILGFESAGCCVC